MVSISFSDPIFSFLAILRTVGSVGELSDCLLGLLYTLSMQILEVEGPGK
jgi:hypothetical protein